MEQTQAQDIISLPIETPQGETKFRLVHVAAQRVRQLSSGAPMLVSSKSIKDATIALEESLTGKMKVIVGEEAEKAKEEYRKREERARLEEQLSAKEEEIRKELSAYLSETRSDEGTEEAGSEEESEISGDGALPDEEETIEDQEPDDIEE